jgi:hypothetical protein
VEVNSGDLITIGGTTLKVEIVDCPHAGNYSEAGSIWAGQNTRKDCPLAC